MFTQCLLTWKHHDVSALAAVLHAVATSAVPYTQTLNDSLSVYSVFTQCLLIVYSLFTQCLLTWKHHDVSALAAVLHAVATSAVPYTQTLNDSLQILNRLKRRALSNISITCFYVILYPHYFYLISYLVN